ncbi:unnamed protein product, partial [Effrenium voratum]
QDYGLYYIGQRIGCGEGRLDVCHRDVSAEKSGYLLTIDWAKPGKVALKSNSTSTYFNVLYPAGSLRPSEHSFLQDLIDAVDRVAAGGPGRPLAELLDFRSFLRYFIVEELAKDVDGYSFSNFVKISEGRIFHAAPWDFDLAFNFACMPRYFTNILTGKVEVDEKGWNVENGRTDALWIGPSGFPGGSVREFGMNKRQLFLNIWRSPGFKAAFASTWRSVRHRLGDGALRSMVERRSRVIEASAERDLDIWKSTERCAFWRCCVAETHSFQRASQDLAEYLVDRRQCGSARRLISAAQNGRERVGAMPGKLIQCLKSTGCGNPVVLIDEIDKLGRDMRGDPSSALLEVLDPEQNSSFRDHYLDVPIDLSNILFLCTANVLDTIPGPLLDRMEVIRIAGYVFEEKLAIASKYLIPQTEEGSGIGADRLDLGDEVLQKIIKDYAREAGVRNLRQLLEKVSRKVALDLVRKKCAEEGPAKINLENLTTYIGQPPESRGFWRWAVRTWQSQALVKDRDSPDH